MRIDLDEERGLVYKLLHGAGIPTPIKDDMFQEFAVYFYSNYKYDDTYKKSTYIHLLFGNWLSYSAARYRTKNAVMEKAERIEDKRADWLDWMQSENDEGNPVTQPELTLYCEELMVMFKPLTQEYIVERMEKKLYDNDKEEGVIRRIARQDGVSRQAIEQRIKSDMKKVLKNLKQQ